MSGGKAIALLAVGCIGIIGFIIFAAPLLATILNQSSSDSVPQLLQFLVITSSNSIGAGMLVVGMIIMVIAGVIEAFVVKFL